MRLKIAFVCYLPVLVPLFGWGVMFLLRDVGIVVVLVALIVSLSEGRGAGTVAPAAC